MEWPPRSGRRQSFPEADRAGWFTLAEARRKLTRGQVPIVEALSKRLGADAV
jgi:predicted NUDIX family NTP pyrophosphohydrolase